MAFSETEETSDAERRRLSSSREASSPWMWEDVRSWVSSFQKRERRMCRLHRSTRVRPRRLESGVSVRSAPRWESFLVRLASRVPGTLGPACLEGRGGGPGPTKPRGAPRDLQR